MIFNEFRGQKFCFALPLLYELPQQTFLPDFDSQIQVEWRVVVSSSLLG